MKKGSKKRDYGTFEVEWNPEGLYPLILSTLSNMQHSGVESALTGPVSRGDTTTIEKHLQELANNFPQYAELYRVLGRIALSFMSVQTTIQEENYNRMIQLMK